MMTEQEQPGPQPDDVEQKEKKEAPEKGGQEDDPEQLRKQVASERTRNDKLEKTVNKEEGNEQANERKTGPERVRELIKQHMQVAMQEELGMTENTDFSKRDTTRLRSDYALLQQSKEFVTSHTPESLATSGIMDGELKASFDQYKSENPDDATAGGLQGADREGVATILRESMLEMLNSTEKKVVDELKTRGVDPAQEREKRENDGDQLKPVRGTPGDRDFSRGARNSMRNFRDLINDAKTPEGLRYGDMVMNSPQNNDQKAAARKFNVLADKFNDALQHCAESGASAPDKNARALAVKEYGKDMVKDPVTNPENLPNFKDWITRNPDKFKTAQEQARKSRE